MTKVMTVRQALAWAEARLAHTDESALASRMLLAHVFTCSLTSLYLYPDRVLSGAQQAAYRHLIARRAQFEPVAYLLGHRAFFDLDLSVDQRVLIPRPETELLVEEALRRAGRWSRPRLVDVGTGSGAIAISLARHIPQAQVIATDRSREALELARENAGRCGVMGRVHFVQADLLAPLVGPLHMVVANLPYVSEAEYAALPPDIRLWEPYAALVAGADGLDAIRALLTAAKSRLAPDGFVLLEIGAKQGAAACAFARRVFPAAQVNLLTDYAQLDRLVCVDLAPTRKETNAN